jgi:membrane-bound lytic murein transglycosylase F
MRSWPLAVVLVLTATVVWAKEAPDVHSRVWTDKYDRYFKKYTKRYFGPLFDWRWFKAQGIAESGLNPKARSRTGAIGIMQILPSTFKEIKKKNPIVENLHEPEWNIAAGIFYDRYLYRKWDYPVPTRDRLLLTFASYNAGFGAVMRAKRKAGADPPLFERVEPFLPRQARNYVNRILALKQEQKRRRLHGLEKYLAGDHSSSGA